MKKVKNPRFLVSAIALVTLVFLSLPAINAWADEQCILFIETDGEMRVHGYDENGTPIQIFNSEDELVWEGIIGVEPEVLTGFEPGAYMLVGPLDGRNFGAVAIVDEPIGADVDYAQAELESSFSVTEESSELKVLTVPWVATAPTIPHIAYNGHPTTFKAIARGGAGSYTYDWDFNGDDEYDYSNTTTNGYNLSAKHTYPDQTSDKTFIARIRVTSGAETVTGEYPVQVMANATIQVKVDVAIDDGLWRLHLRQTRRTNDGYWTNAGSPHYSSYTSSPTASAVQAFEINGHLETGDDDANPYVETVSRGLKYMFTTLNTVSFPGHPADTNGNGYGIQVKGGRPIYELGQVMDAIAATGTPDAVATTGGSGIIGRAYYDILTDMVDMYAWGQKDSGSDRGGWRYSWNSDSDNSAAQWGAIGMLAAEEIFGIEIPQWVKDQNNGWLNYSYQSSTGRFGYTSSGSFNYSGYFTTPSGMVQLAFDDKTTSDSRWRGAENWIANNWDSWRNSQYYYAYYAFAKAMREAQQHPDPEDPDADPDPEPEPVVNLSATGLDWYGDPDRGLARRLVDTQQSNGSWPYSGWPYVGNDLTDAWCVIILNRTLFEPSPVAIAKASPKEANPSDTVTFDHSGSYHLNPDKTLVKFRWDFGEDDTGDWDFETTDINEKPTYEYNDDIDFGEVVEHKVTLQVEDEDGKTDEDDESVIIRISLFNHPPVADADPTDSDPNYEVGQGGTVLLDASQSYDPDSGKSEDERWPGEPDDYIVSWEWDLNNDDVYDVEGETYSFDTPDDWEFESTHTVQLRVTDHGGWAGPDGGGSKSSENSATIYVVPNLPPDADAGEDKTVEQETAAGTTVTLDGSDSTDDGQLQPLTYTWTEEETTLGTGETLSYTFQLGTHGVTLTVYDGQFSDSDMVIIRVQDNTPPTVIACDDITVEQATADGTEVTLTAEISDICDASPTVTWSHGPTAVFPLGNTTVTVTVEDASGNSASDTVVVNVVDTTPPDLTVPADVTVEQETQQGTEVTLTATATDICDADVTITDDSLAVYPLGETTVTFTAIDDSGNVSIGTTTVTVVDTTPPVITPTGTVHVLWPPNHKYHTITISDCVASVEDICDAGVSVADVVITSVSSDEPEDAKGGGDGKTRDDIVIVDSQTVQLRAERQGGGNGRVYTINYQVTDTSGNTATGSCKVSVPHDQDGEPAVDDGPGAGYTVYP